MNQIAELDAATGKVLRTIEVEVNPAFYPYPGGGNPHRVIFEPADEGDYADG